MLPLAFFLAPVLDLALVLVRAAGPGEIPVLSLATVGWHEKGWG